MCHKCGSNKAVRINYNLEFETITLQVNYKNELIELQFPYEIGETEEETICNMKQAITMRLDNYVTSRIENYCE